MVKRIKNWFRRRLQTEGHYALLVRKLSRRLGIARSRYRQAEAENRDLKYRLLARREENRALRKRIEELGGNSILLRAEDKAA